MADPAIETPVQAETLVSEWDTTAIDVGWIKHEISRLWVEWEGVHPESVVSMSAEPAKHVYMRPATVNLIAVAEGTNGARHLESAVNGIPNYTPSRTIVLARGGRNSVSEEFGVRIEITEGRQRRRSAPIRKEIVTITAQSGNDDILASVTSALLVPDLPDVLYVPRDPVANNPLVSSLLDIVDHFLVDTSTSVVAGESLDLLRGLPSRPGNPRFGDLTWTRIRNWRQLIAQFFDSPATLACLDTIDRVDIVVAARNGGGRSGLTSGLLLAGWMASRLNWKVPGELVEGENGWKLTLRAGAKRKSREILLTLEEGTAPLSCSSIVSVTISSSGEFTGEFAVRRSHVEAISTVSDMSGSMKVDRLVHSPCPEESTLLGEQLRLLREEAPYLEALIIAADLWPHDLETDDTDE